MTSVQGGNADELFEGQVILYKHIYGFFNPMSVKWAVQLGIPDIIHNHGQPITLSELVSALKLPTAKAGSVQRYMRLLVHNGFFSTVSIHDKEEEEEKEAYVLTPASKLLVKGSEHCLSPMVKWVVNTDLFNINNKLGDWMYGDTPTLFEFALGVGCWDLIHNNPEYLRDFNDGMASDSQMINLALRECSSVFEGLDSIVDVGGGNGATGNIISEAFPKLKYVVLDLPPVVANLSGTNNLSYVGGDMFKSIPQADGVLLKWVMHNWSDEDCKRILENCRDAISSKGKGGKVIIIDIVINEKQDGGDLFQTKLLLDVAMMALSGKERNEKEWKKLFIGAGFKRYKVFPIFGFRSLIEVYP